jgi:uncharacterized protein YutD|tara:strand:- start:1983 stop:2900 length:918 start_codon:yes stop_codon:yes gene_type:complete
MAPRKRGKMTARTETDTLEEDYNVNLEPTPYENEYRGALSDPDEEDNIEDPIDMATPQRKKQGLVEKNATNESDAHDYKKRYSDLKKHYDTKLNEWKQEQELLHAELSMAEKSKGLPELPKSEEELEEFRTKYPDVYDVVETISSLKASDKVKEIEGRLEDLKVKEQEAIVQTAEQELLTLHPDFEALKESQGFLNWLDEQPQNISDGIYKNNTDTKWAARVIDLYKADNGQVSQTKSPKQNRQSPKKAAEAVTKTKQRRYIEDLQDDTKVWTVSEISKLKPQEFALVEKSIDKAAKEGRVVNSL